MRELEDSDLSDGEFEIIPSRGEGSSMALGEAGVRRTVAAGWPGGRAEESPCGRPRRGVVGGA
jgi:hypothetical protein